MFKMNPKQMEQMMRKMGIEQKDLKAIKVIIELEDKKLVFDHPSVSTVNAMGQETYQVVGTPKVENIFKIEDADIQTVIDQTGCSKEKAIKSLESNEGDIARTILELSDN